jgi:hypothetical protein
VGAGAAVTSAAAVGVDDSLGSSTAANGVADETMFGLSFANTHWWWHEFCRCR